MFTNQLVSRVVYSVITISALLSSQFVFSQAALEEIIVTAQKREQSLQDVPISVTTISGDKFMSEGMRNMEELTQNVPGLSFNESRGSALLFLRGIGTSQGQNSFEQSVSTYVDGVFLGRVRSVRNGLLDVDRIEVLRGPQTTYFGQNTIAGGISIISKQPTEEWEGYINTSYEFEFEELNTDIAYGGPLTDTLGIRVALNYSDFDGYGIDLNKNEPNAGRENLGYRITGQWKPTDALTVTAKYNNANADGDTGSVSEIVGCPPTGMANTTPCNNAQLLGLNADYVFNETMSTGGLIAATTIPGLNPMVGAVDPTARTDIFNTQGHITDTEGFGFNVDYTLANGITLTSISGYRDDFHKNFLDVDRSPIAWVSATTHENYDQLSQEFRITSPGGEVIDWLAGYYYQRSNSTFQVNQFFGFMGGAHRGIYYHEESEWNAVFGGVTWHASDQLSVDLGLRYTMVEKEGIRQTQDGGMYDLTTIGSFNPLVLNRDDCRGIDGFVTPDCAYGEFNDNDLNYSIGVNWDIPDRDTMLYAKFSTGFKAGGTTSGGSSLLDESFFEYQSEKADAYEIGAKSAWLDGRLELNAALFRTEISNAQVSTTDDSSAGSGVPLQITGNAGSLVSQGFELDGRFAATDNLTLSYSFLYLDAFYDDYAGANCNPDEITAGFSTCTAQVPDGMGGFQDQETTNRGGSPIEYSTDIEFNIGATYRIPLDIANGLNLDFSGELYHNNGYNPSSEYSTRFVQDSYQRVNLRATLSPMDGPWSVSLFGDNITDEIVLVEVRPGGQNGDDANVLIAQKGAGYGVQFRYDFGAF